MSVYVGILFTCIPNRHWRYRTAAHLFSDSEDELHVFAQSIGLLRSWFQSNTIPHYDLTKNKRKLAISHGALSVTRNVEAEYICKNRNKS